ncbi:MAG: nucleoside recognition domain-containing protein, partial [Candidatus Thorarchaeota archaeon]
IILWFLANTGPGGFGAESHESFIGIIGGLGTIVFAPQGFPWQIVAALIFGLLAKEIVVEALGIIYSVQGEAAIGASLAAALSPLSALALMVFVLLYTPCIATVGIIRSETGSWKWTGFSVAYQLILAYAVSLLVVLIGGFFVP